MSRVGSCRLVSLAISNPGITSEESLTRQTIRVEFTSTVMYLCMQSCSHATIFFLPPHAQLHQSVATCCVEVSLSLVFRHIIFYSTIHHGYRCYSWQSFVSRKPRQLTVPKKFKVTEDLVLLRQVVGRGHSPPLPPPPPPVSSITSCRLNRRIRRISLLVKRNSSLHVLSVSASRLNSRSLSLEVAAS